MDLLTLIAATDKRAEAQAAIIELLSTFAEGLTHVNLARLADTIIDSYYVGMQMDNVYELALLNARPYISEHYDYSTFSARLMHKRTVMSDVLKALNLSEETPEGELLAAGLRLAKRTGQVDLRLLDGRFNLEILQSVIKPSRNANFNLLAMQTLYDRYFMHDNGIRFETIQTMFMRVAMGLAVLEEDPTAKAVEFYEVLSQLDGMSSTPTLFNAGTKRPQLSSCYLTTIGDDLEAIYDGIKDNAMLSKWAGGLGNDWSSVRALNSHIYGTNGKSQGTIPFLKVANDTAVAVNQGGKRKGAVCAYLTTWHMDIEEFLELRKNTGDDRRRTHDMNTANWIPDEFMRRVFEDRTWTLFTPSEVPELNELFGAEFEEKYKYYEENAKALNLLHRVVNAKDLWRKMLSMVFETGHPWITFKDTCNIRSPQSHVGIVRSSNLCTEITLNTSADEIAVCNLASINLVNHIVNGVLDVEKLKRTITTLVRMLDNVIDVNYYPVVKARTSNLRHRPVGLGIMGFQDALHKMKISYASQAAIDFADESMELISYYAIKASADLARERGAYESFPGSSWSKGEVPLDTLATAVTARGVGYAEVDMSTKLGQAAWDEIRELVKGGMRNSNVMAIAPTATISNICGVSQSIEPTFENIYVKSNLSGEFIVSNRYLVDALEELGLWSPALARRVIGNNGSVRGIPEIPAEIAELFPTAFELGAQYIVEAGARRQKWIDQAQSLNLYIADADGKKLDRAYKMAWIRMLKTTYYLRAKGATTAEKSTGDTHLNAVSANIPGTAAPVPGACSIDNPDCEACQ